MTAAATADDATPRDKLLGKIRLAALWIAGGAIVALGLVGRPDPLGWGVGLVVAGLGVGVRSWAAGYLIKSRALITGGPYAYVRNPLYLGNVLLTLGATFISELLWFVPIAIALFLVQYLPIVRWEESILIERFGEEYRAYCRRVPR